MSFKIAIIGAGSVGFTKKLFTDILCVPEFRDVEFALTDVSEHNLTMIKAILDRIVAANKLPTRVTATTERRKALDGARYVISCVRVGGLEAYAEDIRIPLKYGIDQCVGDTICAGGILYGQRNIPVIPDFCKDIRDVAETGAKFVMSLFGVWPPSVRNPSLASSASCSGLRRNRENSLAAVTCYCDSHVPLSRTVG